ncbi:hypothetical protein ZPAH1_orf00340 [Aeromonas phage ZPAH1]|nr:hypothetical protein ASwh1_294 [Aeromonas phage Aswh_1]QQG34102.1 hypothetical protein ZPAH1_orf00340 [Aeromonas phage ZPAH1]
MKKIIIALSILVLSACSSTPVEPAKDLVYHPTRPVPVKTYVPNWVVVADGDKTVVGMTYEESLKYRAWLEKLGNYIDSQNKMLCVYREELKEDQCKKAPK